MESYFKLGLKEDLKEDYRKAIEAYSKSIENEELALDAHLNLIVILIEVCFDYGITSHLILNKIYTQDKINDLHKFLNSLLQKSLIVFDSNEIEFWKYYKESYYTGLKRDKVKAIIEKDESSLIPYFQLYIDDLAEDREVLYYPKIEKLKRLLEETPTIKNKYVLSIIESAENQKRLNQI